MYLYFKKHCNIKKKNFADDTNIFCASKNLIDLEIKLNQELIAVAEWMKSNRLALSIVKTSFILFHS